MLAWENFPQDLKDKISVETSRATQFKIGFGKDREGGEHFSSVLVRTKGRSGTFNRVHVSEFAKICKQEPSKAREIISGTIQAVPLGGRVDIESTAEGDIGDFHDMFWEAWERGEPQRPVDYKAHFYNWRYDDDELEGIIPELDLPSEFKDYKREHSLTNREITYYYYKWLSLNRNWSLLRQEYPTTPEEAFVSSGDKFFDVDFLKKLRRENPKKVGEWRYYAEYKPGHRYALGADVGEGIGKHGSAVVIVDFDWKIDIGAVSVTKPKVVADYWSNHIAADQFAYEIKNGGTKYGNCLAAVERNNHGHATLSTLKGIYNNIYVEIKPEFKEDRHTERLGWHTNAATKPKMMHELRTAFNEELLLVPSRELQRELWTYPKPDLGVTKFHQDDEHHWDRVIALAIAWQMRAEAIPSLRKDEEYKQEKDETDPLAILPEF